MNKTTTDKVAEAIKASRNSFEGALPQDLNKRYDRLTKDIADILEEEDRDSELLYGILKFYRDDVSHGNKEGTCGLNRKSKEYKKITRILKCLEEKFNKTQFLKTATGCKE